MQLKIDGSAPPFDPRQARCEVKSGTPHAGPGGLNLIRRRPDGNNKPRDLASSVTPAHCFGQTFKRMRLSKGLKQSHAAELLNVTQATISRWERGELVPSPTRAHDLLCRLRIPEGADLDSGLKRLVRSAHRPCHLICDLTHRLLAASFARLSEWGRSESELSSTSLWSFATDEIRQAELRLRDVGWYDGATPAVLTYTGEQNVQGLRFKAGYLLWEQIRLSDGSRARIVSSGALDELVRDVPQVAFV
jgi:transcriptional regulator with XRE-family HTH domain